MEVRPYHGNYAVVVINNKKLPKPMPNVTLRKRTVSHGPQQCLSSSPSLTLFQDYSGGSYARHLQSVFLAAHNCCPDSPQLIASTLV